MRKSLFAALLALCLAAAALPGCSGGGAGGIGGSSQSVDAGPAAYVGDEDYAAYAEAIDTAWAYGLAVEVMESGDYADNRLGDRQSGSDAEHRTADKIASVMKEIGLSGVTKDAVKVDRIQAGDSGLTLDGDEREIVLHAYQTAGTPKGGLAADVVDVGRGTLDDYEGKDVKGKIVLFDVDQRADWWIGTPVTQAIQMGAAAAIANNVSGFSEIATDAYNANDFCGPMDIPTASITQDDAAYVRERMADGRVGATLVVGNEYSKDGESYNVYGTIKGKDSSEAIMFGAHYDAYYESFQDDTIAWAGVLAIAKAMVDSGYVPERDIVFCCHGAEEWGTADTSYDWAVGSYRQITEARPEWQGRTLAFINFELSAYEFADYTYTHSAPESYAMVKAYTEAEGTAQPDGVYNDGILTEGYQTYTYSDDFAYYVSGVPSFINGFLVDVKSEDGDVFDFYKKYYHTNYDTKDTYNEKVFDWQLKFYGGLGMHIDRTPALELDFTGQADRLEAALDGAAAVLGAGSGAGDNGGSASALVSSAGADDGDGGGESALPGAGSGAGDGGGAASGADAHFAYETALAGYRAAAEGLAAKAADVNARYAGAEADEERAAIMQEARALNAKALAVFKRTQECFVGLWAEEPIVPHEWYARNVALMQETMVWLASGDVAMAADEVAWQINGATEWYAMAFDEATVEHSVGTYQGKYASQNWAAGKTYENADVQAATRSLIARYDEAGGDFSGEAEVYEAAIAAQRALLAELVMDEAGWMDELAAMMGE